MAVTFPQILYPLGELTRSMFPDDTLEDVAAIWFDDATEQTASITDSDLQDAAFKAWVYYRAYSVVANNIAMRPTSSSYFGSERSETWGADRIKFYERKAQENLDKFNTYAEPTVINDAVINYSAVATRTVTW